MPLVLRPPGEHLSLPHRLRSLGVARKAALITTGVGRFVAVAVAGIALACLLDVAVHLPPAVRALLLVGLLGGLVAGYVCWVRRSLREPSGSQAMAHLLEKRYPALNDSLASAVWFLERPDPFAGSPRFRQVAVARAETLAERNELAAVIPSAPAWRAVLAALVVIAVAGPLALWDTDRTTTALVRVLDPFGRHPWPPKTRLELTAPSRPVLLAKGNPLPVTAVLRGELPAEAVLSVRPVGGPAVDEHLSLTASEADASEVQLTATVPADRAAADFEFRLTANDADTGWVPVTVAPPPKLVPLDGRPSPRLHLEFPAYTLLPAIDLADGSGAIEAVAGTRVSLIAATDRRIVSAVVRRQDENTDIEPALAIAPLAGQMGFAGLLAAEFTADIPVRISGPDGTRLSAEFAVPRPGLYAMLFTDERGLTGSRLLDVRSFPDPAPAVELERPSPATDALDLLPTANVTVRARVMDRAFGVRAIFVEYRVNDGPVVVLSLADFTRTTVVAGAMTAVIRPPGAEVSAVFPIARFVRSDGKPPADGDVITLLAAATDFDDHTLLKQPGRSDAVEIRVLTADSLTARIQRDLAALRPELARVRDAQADAAARLAEVRKAAEKGPLSPEDRDKLAQVEQAQRQLRGPVADPTAGLRAKADRLRDAATANNLPRSSVTARAEAVARALENVDRKHLTEIDAPLADAKRPDPKAAAKALADAARHQQGIKDGVEAALEELEPWAAAAEVRGDARAAKERADAARKAAEALAGKTPPGTPTEQLPADQKLAVEKLADELAKAAEQAGRLATKADRVAAEKRAQADRDRAANPDAASQSAAEAQALDKATKAAGGQQAADKLRDAAAAQRANRSGEAAAAAAAAADRLAKMADALSETTDPNADLLQKKRKESGEQIGKLAEQQDLLAKKAKQTAANPDPAAKADELQKLSGEQDELRREAEKLSRKLDREGSPDAAEQLRRAGQQMEQARDELDAGRDPTEKADEALDRLNDAKDKLQPDAKPDADQLAREKRDDLAKQLKALAERQKGAVAESERLTAASAAAKRWERPLVASVARLADGQTALADEVRGFAEKNLKETPVFDRMARSAAEQMTRAATRLRERKDDALVSDPAAFDPEAEAAADEVARRPMRVALKRLEEIAAAVAPDDKKKPNPQQPGQPMPEGGPMPMGGGGPMGKGGGLPPLAQLKALRDWQADVNARTAEFAKAHPDPATLTDDDRADLRELEQAQKDIAELFGQLLPLIQGGGEMP